MGIFIIIFGIQVELSCLAVSRLLNTDATDYLLLDHVFSPSILFIRNRLYTRSI